MVQDMSFEEIDQSGLKKNNIHFAEHQLTLSNTNCANGSNAIKSKLHDLTYDFLFNPTVYQ